MSDTNTLPNDCGCCGGRELSTPVVVNNRPGLPAIEARVGTYGQFRESLLARLSAATHPELDHLRTREPDDYSVALLDAWAMVADVLTFYQERIANESYLRTATESVSVRALAAEIGYELGRGVSASTALAFTVEETTGAPETLKVHAGTQVKSVPGPGELPQTFETEATIEARPEWNAVRPKLTKPQALAKDATSAYLRGVQTDLKQGDALIFVGARREANPSRGDFQLCRVLSVEPNRESDWTLVTWDQQLRANVIADQLPGNTPGGEPFPRIYAMRQRAAVFGHNAQDWRPLPNTMKANYLGLADPVDLVEAEKLKWPSFSIFSPIYPPKLRAPVIIPTPRAVGTAALNAARTAVTDAQGAAMTQARIAAETARDLLPMIGDEVDPLIKDMIDDVNKKMDDLKKFLADLQAIPQKIFDLQGAVTGMLGQLKGPEGPRGPRGFRGPSG